MQPNGSAPLTAAYRGAACVDIQSLRSMSYTSVGRDVATSHGPTTAAVDRVDDLMPGLFNREQQSRPRMRASGDRELAVGSQAHVPSLSERR